MPEPDDRRRLQLAAGGQERVDLGFSVKPAAFNAVAKTDDAPAPKKPESTRVDIYSEIGGWAGVWPDEFKSALDSITGGIDLHIHSPGGDAFDGIAIHNMLRQHDGSVDVTIDGLAASAASVIAMAGDKVRMARGAQLMIHDAWGMSMGNAEDMSKMLDMLDKTSNSIASIYAAKAGGTATAWRDAMKAESWYTDAEAVDAGLADEVETEVGAAKNKWDLRVFAHAGRADAPDPIYPAGHRKPVAAFNHITSAAGTLLPEFKAGDRVTAASANALMKAAADKAANSLNTKESGMPDIDEKLDKLIASMNAMATAFAAMNVQPDPKPEPDPEPEPDDDDENKTPKASGSKLPKATKAAEAVMLDPMTLAKLQAQARLGMEAHNEMKKQRRDRVLDKAMDLGKFPPSRREHYATLYDADPDGTVELLDRMAENAVPVDVMGYSGEAESMKSEAQRAYAGLYPEEG